MNSKDLATMRAFIATLQESTRVLKSMTPQPCATVEEWVAQQVEMRDGYESWLKRGAPKDDSFATKFYSRARVGGMALK